MPKDKNKLDHGISPHNVSSSQPKNIKIFYENWSIWEKFKSSNEDILLQKKASSRTLYMSCVSA